MSIFSLKTSMTSLLREKGSMIAHF